MKAMSFGKESECLTLFFSNSWNSTTFFPHNLVKLAKEASSVESRLLIHLTKLFVGHLKHTSECISILTL
jgi:hypothetical protein